MKFRPSIGMYYQHEDRLQLSMTEAISENEDCEPGNRGRLTGKATERAVASIAHIKFHKHSPKKHRTVCVLDFSDMTDILGYGVENTCSRNF
jgi:hypothetical protein